MMWYCSSRRRQKGQILPIAAAAFLIMCGLAGLAIDASRDYLSKRDAQNAADFATLAAAKQMTQLGSLTAPVAANSASVHAAHDFAANNGFSSIYANGCDVTSGTSFSTTWFDAVGPSCNATNGFINKITVNDPPVNLPGSPVPIACQGQGKFTCVQVVITTRISQLFTSILGIPFAYVTVGASAQASLPHSAFDAPPPNALTLYQPGSLQQVGSCLPVVQQCFDESKAVARTLMACTGGTNNCPTLWVKTGTSPQFYGYDGSVFSPVRDLTTVQSAGDMVIQSRSTFCDPYNLVVCVVNAAKGAAGFAVPASTKVYCSKHGVGDTVITPCTTTGAQAGTLNEIDGNQTAWTSPTNWYPPAFDPTGLAFCGSLVLNGDAVTGPCADPVEKYTINPGIYGSIVINHGTYSFETGIFDITGKATVNTLSGGSYMANGIDHSQETTAKDFDLCNAKTATGCGGATPLTAGVWIGHGGGGFGTYSPPVAPVCNSNMVGTDGGGGDATVVSGSNVFFRLESGSGGFVSTNEVAGLALSGAGVGSIPQIGGAPLLIDMENLNAFIHIDAATPGTISLDAGGTNDAANTIAGIVYQNANATGGGFEINLGMNSGNAGTALSGQVLAYTFTTFGSAGPMDFTGGYGTGSLPLIQTSGKNEPQIVGQVTLAAAVGQPNYSTLTVNYTDEWMMDGFDVYVKVNNGSPIFFSQGIWTTTPGPNSPLPPPGNNPGDQFPAYHSPANRGGYTISGSDPTDWTFAIPNSNGSTIEAKGSWNWGHQKDIPNAPQGNYTAKLLYTFPNPTGNYLSVTLFLLDGDRCGDYAYSTYTFRNTGLPGPGAQSIGSVGLVQ